VVKIRSKYDPKFVEFLKGIGAKWDSKSRMWDVPESRVKDVEAKVKELNVQGFELVRASEEATSKEAEGVIRMRLSEDGRFVLVSVNLLAFSEDVKQMLDGKRRSVRFRVLPPRRSV